MKTNELRSVCKNRGAVALISTIGFNREIILEMNFCKVVVFVVLIPNTSTNERTGKHLGYDECAYMSDGNFQYSDTIHSVHLSLILHLSNEHPFYLFFFSSVFSSLFLQYYILHLNGKFFPSLFSWVLIAW